MAVARSLFPSLIVLSLTILAASEHHHKSGPQNHPTSGAHSRSGFLKVVDAAKIRGELHRAISDALGNGTDLQSGRFAKVREGLRSMWQSLAKNEEGRIHRRSFQYVLQRYMMKHYQLSIIGLEQGLHANSSEFELMHNAPSFVKRVVDGNSSVDGFSMDDAVAMVVMLEELLAHTGDHLLSGVYRNLQMEIHAPLTRLQLQQVLESYLIRWLLTDDSGSIDLSEQTDAELSQSFDNWRELAQFVEGRIKSFEYQELRKPFSHHRASKYTPFTQTFSFADASALVRSITMSFGSYWRSECDIVKESLLKMDFKHTGRVKLSDFHGAALNGEWRFSESKEYLRHLGALDETSALLGPRVIVPNYLQGASNCIVSDKKYRICCSHDCETFVSDIEAAVGGPTASAELLISVVSNITVGVGDASPAMTSTLKSQLGDIAKAHGGLIPIHGRLFSQWLHYVFPRECAFPHKSGSIVSVSPMQFGDYMATEKELRKHASDTPQQLSHATEQEWMSQWSEEEELLTRDLHAPWEQGILSVRMVAGVMLVIMAAVAYIGKHEGGCAPAKESSYFVGSSTIKDHFV